jgi:hypothetical protein
MVPGGSYAPWLNEPRMHATGQASRLWNSRARKLRKRFRYLLLDNIRHGQ